MKAVLALSAAWVLAFGCSSPRRPQSEAGATPLGVPDRPADGPAAPAEEVRTRDDLQLPDRITIPATYRLILLDGHLALVRETDPKLLESAPGSLRIIEGDPARGEVAYQPALLPQELAAEVAANRESSARMDNALESVMKRSRELSEQAKELEAQGKRLADLLAAAQPRPSAAPEAAKAPAEPAESKGPEN